MFDLNLWNINGVFLDQNTNSNLIDVISIIKHLNEEVRDNELVDSVIKKFEIKNLLNSE